MQLDPQMLRLHVQTRQNISIFLEWMHSWITHTKVHWALFSWLILFSSIAISQIILLKLQCGKSTSDEVRWNRNAGNVYKFKVSVQFDRRSVKNRIIKLFLFWKWNFCAIYASWTYLIYWKFLNDEKFEQIIWIFSKRSPLTDRNHQKNQKFTKIFLVELAVRPLKAILWKINFCNLLKN